MLATAWAMIACLLVNGGLQPTAAQGYTVPTPTISVLSPSGIRFEIAEANGAVTLIAYHYSINVSLLGTDPGRWNYDVAPQDGYFVHENQEVRLNNGDTVYYWVYAIYRGLGYHLLNKQWTYSVESPLLSRSSSMATSTAATTLLGETSPLIRTSSAAASTASSTSLRETSLLNRIGSATTLTASKTSLRETPPVSGTSSATASATSTTAFGVIPPLSRTRLAIASTSSQTSLGAAATPSTTVSPGMASSADVREGFSTTDAITLGVVLGVAVVLAAILSVILVFRSRRNSRRPPLGNSNPPVDKQPEVPPARPLSDGQSSTYEYVDEAYSRGLDRGRSPDESTWPESALPLSTQAPIEPRAGSRPPPPLPQDAGRTSATPATENYYIRLIT